MRGVTDSIPTCHITHARVSIHAYARVCIHSYIHVSARQLKIRGVLTCQIIRVWRTLHDARIDVAKTYKKRIGLPQRLLGCIRVVKHARCTGRCALQRQPCKGIGMPPVRREKAHVRHVMGTCACCMVSVGVHDEGMGSWVGFTLPACGSEG
jgi:hypothetical protein